MKRNKYDRHTLHAITAIMILLILLLMPFLDFTGFAALGPTRIQAQLYDGTGKLVAIKIVDDPRFEGTLHTLRIQGDNIYFTLSHDAGVRLPAWVEGTESIGAPSYASYQHETVTIVARYTPRMTVHIGTETWIIG